MVSIKEFIKSTLLIYAILQHSLFVIILFIYLFLAVLSLCCVTSFSPLVARGGSSLAAVHDFHTAVASLVAEQVLACMAPAVVAPRLQTTGSIVVAYRLIAPQHVGSSQIRDRTPVPCIGRPILNHWTTREVLWYSLLNMMSNHIQHYSKVFLISFCRKNRLQISQNS